MILFVILFHAFLVWKLFRIFLCDIFRNIFNMFFMFTIFVHDNWTCFENSFQYIFDDILTKNLKSFWGNFREYFMIFFRDNETLLHDILFIIFLKSRCAIHPRYISGDTRCSSWRYGQSLYGRTLQRTNVRYRPKASKCLRVDAYNHTLECCCFVVWPLAWPLWQQRRWLRRRAARRLSKSYCFLTRTYTDAGRWYTAFIVKLRERLGWMDTLI